MADTLKTLFVADCVHGAVPIGAIEKDVFSALVINRLHNVLQNSTVFMTYPSNRTSRFSHSIGTMHLAGQIFRAGLANATADHRRRFLRETAAVLRRVAEDATTGNRKGVAQSIHFAPRAYPHGVLSLKGFLDKVDEEDIHSVLDGDALHRSAMGGGVSEPTRFYADSPATVRAQAIAQYSFLVAHQAVRLAAFLHDIGHPPFSHVVEESLESVQKWLALRKADGAPINPRQEAFLEVWEAWCGAVDRKLHEGIGLTIARQTLDDVLHESQERGLDAGACTFRFLASLLAVSILESRTPDEGPAWAMHRIVAGPLDADRLDYIYRDSLMSGISEAPYDFGRLLSTFRLVFHSEHQAHGTGELDSATATTGDVLPYGASHPSDGHAAADTRATVPEFLPSVQALNSIERVLSARFDLYQHVIYHHRVVKTDAMLRDAVFAMAKEYLDLDVLDTNDGPEFVIPQNISGLWRVLGVARNAPGDSAKHLYLQWDDSWLFGVLRSRFFKMVPEVGTKTASADRDSVLFRKLQELLSGRKTYISLYKRASSYDEVDREFLEHVRRRYRDTPLGVALHPIAPNEPSATAGEADPPAVAELPRRVHNTVAQMDGADFVSRILSGRRPITDRSTDMDVAVTRFRSEFGFFSTFLIKYVHDNLRSRGGSAASHRQYADSVFRDACKRLIDRSRGAILDCSLIGKSLKTGLPEVAPAPDAQNTDVFQRLTVDSEEFLLCDEHQVVPFRHLSRLPASLDDRAKLFPTHFVFLLPQDPHGSINVAASRSEFGACLADAFVDSFTPHRDQTGITT